MKTPISHHLTRVFTRRLSIALAFAAVLASCSESKNAAPIDRSADAVPIEVREAAKNAYYFSTRSVGGACPRTVGSSSFSIAYKAEEDWRTEGENRYSVGVSLWVLGDVELLDVPSFANHKIAERFEVDSVKLSIVKDAGGRWTAACDSIRAYLRHDDAGDSAMYVNPAEFHRLLLLAGVSEIK